MIWVVVRCAQSASWLGPIGLLLFAATFACLQQHFCPCTGFASDQCPEGFVAVAKNTLRILTLERLGEPFNQQLCRLRYTPRKFVIHQEHKVRQVWMCRMLLPVAGPSPAGLRVVRRQPPCYQSGDRARLQTSSNIFVMHWPCWQSLCLSKLHAATHCRCSLTMLLQVLVIIESDAASVPWQERLDQQQEVKKEDGTVQMTSAEVGLLAFLHPAAPAASSAFHVLSDATLMVV